jgi:hypothetical protein
MEESSKVWLNLYVVDMGIVTYLSTHGAIQITPVKVKPYD